ncbi:hypothetical protein DFH09DRAFT_916614, partial [Mycena vulgaris]
LGRGGMGKTSLARAVLHHSEVVARYDQHRVFVASDTTSTSVQLAALIGAHIGLKPVQDLTQPVIQYFTSSPGSLLVLDNLETTWEPTESRGGVEKFLSLLGGIDHLALIITMRGAERPANVRWSHPFLEPLKPLAPAAARQTFIDIADDGHSSEEIEKILHVAENMPLAIDLLAHLTSLLSMGHKKGSNLDLSISLSLESPRMTSLPSARHLLGLLSILPDGLSNGELNQSKLPIDQILACKTALLRTSLAYVDDDGRLKVLVPIREYVQKKHPPMAHLVRPLLDHFTELLETHETYAGTVSGPGIVTRIISNFANIQNILLRDLTPDNPNIDNTIYSTCRFNCFSRLAGRGGISLMGKILNLLPHSSDQRLRAYAIAELFWGCRYHPIDNARRLIDQAREDFLHLDKPNLECELHPIPC